MITTADGKISNDCQEGCRFPSADNYLYFPDNIVSCQEGAEMEGKNDNGQFMKGHKLSPRNRIIKVCEFCQGEYRVVPSQANRTRFCSRRCKGLYWRGLVKGMGGKHHTEESKKKMSDSLKGKIPWNLGKKHTEESKKKMRRKRSPETCIKIRNLKKGHKTSDEQKRKTSLTIRRLYKEGKIQTPWKGKTPWLGKKHTDATKKLLSDIRKGKSLSDGTRLKISNALKGKKRPQCGIKNIGEDNPNWKGGISFEPYCPKFNKQLKEFIRERDKRTCQLCGMKENGRKLHIHHIHYDKPNCNPDLIALCISCNVKVNFNRDYWENYFINLLKTRELK